MKSQTRRFANIVLFTLTAAWHFGVVAAPAADHSAIRANRNDLSYVTVEIVDQNGNRIPNAAIPIHFTTTGAGELAATGSSAPNDASSFRAPFRTTYQGRCLATLRPKGDAGKITLKAEADGLKGATVVVKTH